MLGLQLLRQSRTVQSYTRNGAGQDRASHGRAEPGAGLTYGGR